MDSSTVQNMLMMNNNDNSNNNNNRFWDVDGGAFRHTFRQQEDSGIVSNDDLLHWVHQQGKQSQRQQQKHQQQQQQSQQQHQQEQRQQLPLSVNEISIMPTNNYMDLSTQFLQQMQQQQPYQPVCPPEQPMHHQSLSSLGSLGSFGNFNEPDYAVSSTSFGNLAAALNPTPIKQDFAGGATSPLQSHPSMVSINTSRRSTTSAMQLQNQSRTGHNSGTMRTDTSTSTATTQKQVWTTSNNNNDTVTAAATKMPSPSTSSPSAHNDTYAQNGILGPWSVLSASLLGDMALTTENGTLTSKKKTKATKDNKPKRPLSAYNIFFKEERNRILERIPDGDAKKSASTRKRKKRPHGKIGFESLAKTIGQRWRSLNKDELAIYKSKAQEDLQRYKLDMEAFVSTEASRQRTTMEPQNSSDISLEPTPMAPNTAASGMDLSNDDRYVDVGMGMFSQLLQASPQTSQSQLGSHIFRL